MDSLKPFKKDWKKYILVALVLSNAFVWLAVYERRAGNVLSVYFLNVGQGDAVLIDSPLHGRVLIDGGPNRKVLAELGKVLSFGDRRIDAVLATHPDKDHIGGLPEVVARYKVGVYIESGAESENTIDDELRRRLGEKDIARLVARRGMVVNFGDGARLVVLFPDGDVSGWDTNDASIVAKLEYGEHTFLLTGDAGLKTEMALLLLDAGSLDASVLKAGHHGSRTSTTASFAQAVAPEYAVISAGKGNSYGHPHKEVLNNLENVGAAVFSTASRGTIVFKSDGKKLKIK